MKILKSKVTWKTFLMSEDYWNLKKDHYYIIVSINKDFKFLHFINNQGSLAVTNIRDFEL